MGLGTGVWDRELSFVDDLDVVSLNLGVGVCKDLSVDTSFGLGSGGITGGLHSCCLLLSSVVLLSLKRANPIQLHSELTCDGLSFRSHVMALS